MQVKLEKKRFNYWALKIVFFLFIILYLYILIFHEPWFDEAQVWEIAKGATLKEILFVIPHYEGHPPLWSLILSVPAKLGVPFEVGLKSIGACISIISTYLILFRSKLPTIIKCLVPFSYFFFYQFGVVVRPYGLMQLILIILGLYFHEWNDHPKRIIFLLALLCLCSAYGIVIAGGLSLCLVIDLLQKRGLKNFISNVFSDKRTLSLFFLLIFAFILILQILPYNNTYSPITNDRNPFLLCVICSIFTFPAECFLTSASWFKYDRLLLQYSSINLIELAILCLIGLIMWTLIICSSSKGKLKYMLIPYILFALFSGGVYFSAHHLGVVFSFFLFWGVYICKEKDGFEIGKSLKNSIVEKSSDAKLLVNTYKGIVLICLLVPISWTISASINEVKYDYYYGKAVANFLKANHLDQLKILGSWHEEGSSIPFSEGNESYVNTVMIGSAPPINAYFKYNIFLNLNHNNKSKGYIYHRRPSYSESQSDIMEWKRFGLPDVIIGKPFISLVYGEEINYSHYKLVFLSHTKFIWKNNLISEKLPVFLRKDLIDRYQLEPLEGIEYIGINGFVLTEEMKERYENGESMEVILSPYLDIIFDDDN